MSARRLVTLRFMGLLAAAVVVLQFATVQHATAHGGAAPDVGCEFCLSGAGAAPPSNPAPAAHARRIAGPMAPAAVPSANPKPRRSAQPARAPPLLA